MNPVFSGLEGLALGVGLPALAAIATMALAAVIWRNRRRRMFEGLAPALGLEPAPPGSPSSLGRTVHRGEGWLRGSRGGLPVEAFLGASPGSADHFSLWVGGPPPEITIRHESVGDVIGPSSDLSIGDPAFDVLQLEGPPLLLRALLDRRTRRLVSEALHDGLSISGGAVRQSIPIFGLERERLDAELDRVVGLARSLRLDRPAVERLASIVDDEEEPVAVRKGALAALLADGAGSDAAVRVGDRALASPRPELRLEAARHRERGAVLFDLVADASVAVPLRVEALRAMRAAGPAGSAWLRGGDAGKALLDLYAAVARTPVDPDTALERLAALTAMVDALGEFGTVEAVEPLSRDWHRDADLHRMAKNAVLRIQSRLAGAERGQLSLSETAAAQGALSEAASAGALSAPDRSGREAAERRVDLVRREERK